MERKTGISRKAAIGGRLFQNILERKDPPPGLFKLRLKR